jgi:hypothetical protein
MPDVGAAVPEKVSETIDLTEEKPLASGATAEVAAEAAEDHGSDADLNKETKTLLKASHLRSEKKYEEATKILHSLDKSSFKQIRVRAKYMIGDIMFEQKEYDLAMQIFEELLHESAFSGHTILSLQKLSVCAKELQLVDKEKKYKSLEQRLMR